MKRRKENLKRVEEMWQQIITKYPETMFTRVGLEWEREASDKYPGIPQDLLYLYFKYGYGEIGRTAYRVHCLKDPSDILGLTEGLEGILIVGDDSAGTCQAYDVANSWRFGVVDYKAKFKRYRYCRSFVDYLQRRFGGDVDD